MARLDSLYLSDSTQYDIQSRGPVWGLVAYARRIGKPRAEIKFSRSECFMLSPLWQKLAITLQGESQDTRAFQRAEDVLDGRILVKSGLPSISWLPLDLLALTTTKEEELTPEDYREIGQQRKGITWYRFVCSTILGTSSRLVFKQPNLLTEIFAVFSLYYLGESPICRWRLLRDIDAKLKPSGEHASRIVGRFFFLTIASRQAEAAAAAVTADRLETIAVLQDCIPDLQRSKLHREGKPDVGEQDQADSNVGKSSIVALVRRKLENEVTRLRKK